MPSRFSLKIASGSLLDQGVVSVGAFLLNIQLARHLPVSEYGTYALLMGAQLGLLIITTSLVLYPLTVHVTITEGALHSKILRTTGVLVVLAAMPLALLLAIGLAVFGRSDLVAPAVAYFCLQLIQTSTRRALLADMRAQSALLGDSVAYLLPAAVVTVLASRGELTLSMSLYAMAGTFGLAAMVQIRQLRLSTGELLDVRAMIGEYWALGRWALVSAIFSHMRLQAIPWTLAAVYGASSAAHFQAALNIVNLTNPIIIGLGNIIPQTAARALAQGPIQAWRASRVYAIFGAVPAYAYYAAIMVFPEIFLRIFYGAGSSYADLSWVVRLLAIAAIGSFVVEVVSSYLYGISATHSTMIINAVGLAVAVLFAIPMAAFMGITGGCLALVGADCARLIAAKLILQRSTAEPRLGYA